jgi:positive regulator of sigma E activity
MMKHLMLNSVLYMACLVLTVYVCKRLFSDDDARNFTIMFLSFILSYYHISTYRRIKSFYREDDDV